VVIDRYEAGRMLADFRSSNGSSSSQLTSSESALLALLEASVE